MGLKKQVIQYKDGAEIATFNSAQEAADAIGSSKSNISKCCLGKLSNINGYTFKYTGEVTNKHVDKGDIKCPYCDRKFENYNGLCKHVIKGKMHGEISQEKLLADMYYNGERPKCKCGCGEYTEISYDGGAHFCDFIKGHQSRVHNNWGHNEKAKLNSAVTRRKQFLNGERVQWNKGRSWEDTYSKETIEKLLKTYEDVERNKKISEKLKGVPKSYEHAEKCREIGRAESTRKAISEKLFKRIKNQEFSLSSQLEKDFIEDFIKPLGIEYTTQLYIKDIHQYCDIYIPSKNAIIEIDGDFWHANPLIFPDGPKYEYQKKHIEKDRIKNEYLLGNGYRLLRLWEHDIRKNVEIVKENINNLLK